MGGTGVLMQGGIHPDLKIDWFERLFTGIKQRFPKIWLHCLSASEVLAIAEYSELSLRDTIIRLRDAGLDSIPGGGAEILDDDVRKRIARLKCRTDDWVSVHRTAHELGMRTTATMMFGVGETFEQRINHFEVVRQLQEETGGFTAFIPWSFQPKNTALGGRGWDEATSVEYLNHVEQDATAANDDGGRHNSILASALEVDDHSNRCAMQVEDLAFFHPRLFRLGRRSKTHHRRITKRDRRHNRSLFRAGCDSGLAERDGAIGDCGVGREMVEARQRRGYQHRLGRVACRRSLWSEPLRQRGDGSVACFELKRTLGRACEISVRVSRKLDFAMAAEWLAGPPQTQKAPEVGDVEPLEVAFERVARLVPSGGRLQK